MKFEQWGTWLIFGILLVLLVGFLVFSFVKDKRKNMKITQKRIELKRATIKSSKELAIRIYTLIKMNETWLKEVEPGKSQLKMRHVNAIARNFLKEIYDSKPFKVIYIESEQADPQYAINLKTLIDKNSNLWSKYCSNEIEYFKKFNNELLGDESYSVIEKAAEESILEMYNKEIVK